MPLIFNWYFEETYLTRLLTIELQKKNMHDKNNAIVPGNLYLFIYDDQSYLQLPEIQKHVHRYFFSTK